jgi:hypothetical protein
LYDSVNGPFIHILIAVLLIQVFIDQVAYGGWQSSAVINGWCRYSWKLHVPSEDAVARCGHEYRDFILGRRHFVVEGKRIAFAFVDGDWHFEDGESSLFTTFEIGSDTSAVHLEMLRRFRRGGYDGCFLGAIFTTTTPKALVSGWKPQGYIDSPLFQGRYIG